MDGPRSIGACSKDYPGFLTVTTGARVLLIGAPNTSNVGHIDRYYVFPVRGGLVVPQPYPRTFQELTALPAPPTSR